MPRRSGSCFHRKPTPVHWNTCQPSEGENLQYAHYGARGQNSVADQGNDACFQACRPNSSPRNALSSWLNAEGASPIHHTLGHLHGEISPQASPLGVSLSLLDTAVSNLPASPSFSSCSVYNPLGHIDTSTEGVAPFHHASLDLDANPSLPVSLDSYYGSAQLPPDSRRHDCGLCDKAFGKKNDLTRHICTVHACGFELYYRCICGYQQFRKDNYIRHVSRCQHLPLYNAYLCKCGGEIEDKARHLEHVRKCKVGSGTPGRPASSRAWLRCS